MGTRKRTQGTGAGSDGLGTPNFSSIYSPTELDNRIMLVDWFDESTEPNLPLAWFVSANAWDRAENEYTATHGSGSPSFAEWLRDLPDGDTEFAAAPGFTGKDVLDARLSRTAFYLVLHTIPDMADEDVMSVTEWRDTVLGHIFPVVGQRAWDFEELADATADESLLMADRVMNGHAFPATSTAGEMILNFVIKFHTDLMLDSGMPPAAINLSDVLLEDDDFLFLFDPAFDGIENTSAVTEFSMTITGPARWFDSFVLC